MTKLKHILISREELQKGLKLKGFFGSIAAWFLMGFMRLKSLNKAYNKAYDKDCETFVDNCLSQRNNNLNIVESDVRNIPSSGPVIFLFNHPYGGLDALIVLKTLLKIRPDTKFIANFLLSKVEPAKPYLFRVNPFETHKSAFSSFSGLKEMYKYIEDGHSICILPAGEVSTTYNSKVVEDRVWQKNIMKYAVTTGAPIVSGYITGANTKLFHWLGKIHPLLRTMRLPIELVNKKNKNITIRFSNPMSPRVIHSFDDNVKLASVLRARTYSLEEDCYDIKLKDNEPKNYKPIVDAIEKELLVKEVETLNNNLLFTTENYSCYFAESNEIPNVFKEISRLRELTFREIGEGTGKETDFDKFDSYYNHLFIWDETDKEIVGAYRIGMGADIIKDKGLEGFYINTLFRFKDTFKDYLSKSMEMGRSFIVPKYQRRTLPLFLLWKGIYVLTQKYPNYKYLIGPASISNVYSKHTKILIIEYLKRMHSWEELNGSVVGRNPFEYTLNDNHKVLLDSFENDLSSFDRIVKDIDINRYGIPILIKKYLSLGGKIIDFNVDPDFNYSIDGFVVLDIDVVSEEVIKSYNK